MANPKRLEARLARLKACVKCLLDPEAEQEKERLMQLHFEMWMFEGSFEDIPEKDRDPELWEFFVRYSPVFLGLI